MRLPTGLLLRVAAFCMIAAGACLNVSLASGDYRGVQLAAFVGMVVADVCCAVVWQRGGRSRWIAAAFALPSLFVVWDLFRRAPVIFRDH